MDSFELDEEVIRSAKERTATLIHAESRDRIALTMNTSDALNIVASGFPWQKDDEIIISSAEFPANYYPWRNTVTKGGKIIHHNSSDGRVPVTEIEPLITGKTRMIALSAVQFLSGYRADLHGFGELCRKRSIFLVVDGIQAVGAIDIDVRSMGIHALACGFQKWMFAPMGTAFLYIGGELQEIIRQSSLGWLGVQTPWNFKDLQQSPHQSARRYEGGTLNYSGFYGVNEALSMLLQVGIDNIERSIQELSDQLIDGLQRIEQVNIISAVERQQRAGIVTISLDEIIDSTDIFNKLKRHNIIVSLREGMIRISPHFYNTYDEIQTFLIVLANLLKERKSSV